MKTFKIKNAWICRVKGKSVNPVFGDLIISDGLIKDIGIKNFSGFIKNKTAVEKNSIDAAGRVFTIPGVNFHDHFYSRLAKGLNIKGPTNNFENILKNLWWKLDRLIDKDILKASAQAAAIDSIKNGVTYIFDHNSSPACTNNSLKIIKETLADFNLRGVLCYEITDRIGKELSRKALFETQRFSEEDLSNDFKTLIGLHASFTVNDSTMSEASKLVNDFSSGIHIHLCEDKIDRETSKKKYNKLPLNRLEKFNLLNEKSILSHSIHLTKKDYNIIDKYGAAIALNPDSNLNNNVGLPAFEKIGMNTLLIAGTDGMHSNPFKSLKQIFLLLRHKGFSFDDAFAFVKKIFFDQIEFVKRFFPDYPELKKNDRADFIIWDYFPPTPLNENNFVGHFVYGIVESRIHSVVQNGKILMKDSKLFFDESSFQKEIYKQGKRLFTMFDK